MPTYVPNCQFFATSFVYSCFIRFRKMTMVFSSSSALPRLSGMLITVWYPQRIARKLLLRKSGITGRRFVPLLWQCEQAVSAPPLLQSLVYSPFLGNMVSGRVYIIGFYWQLFVAKMEITVNKKSFHVVFTTGLTVCWALFIWKIWELSGVLSRCPR